MTTNYESSSACCEEPFLHLSVKGSLSGHLFLRGPHGSPMYDHGAPLVSFPLKTMTWWSWPIMTQWVLPTRTAYNNECTQFGRGVTRFSAILQNSLGRYFCMQPLVCSQTETLSLRLTWWFLGTKSGRSLYCHLSAAGLAPDGHLCVCVCVLTNFFFYKNKRGH